MRDQWWIHGHVNFVLLSSSAFCDLYDKVVQPDEPTEAYRMLQGFPTTSVDAAAKAGSGIRDNRCINAGISGVSRRSFNRIVRNKTRHYQAVDFSLFDILRQISVNKSTCRGLLNKFFAWLHLQKIHQLIAGTIGSEW